MFLRIYSTDKENIEPNIDQSNDSGERNNSTHEQNSAEVTYW